ALQRPRVRDHEGGRAPVLQDPVRHLSPAGDGGEPDRQHQQVLGRDRVLPGGGQPGAVRAGDGGDQLPQRVPAHPRARVHRRPGDGARERAAGEGGGAGGDQRVPRGGRVLRRGRGGAEGRGRRWSARGGGGVGVATGRGRVGR